MAKTRSFNTYYCLAELNEDLERAIKIAGDSWGESTDPVTISIPRSVISGSEYSLNDPTATRYNILVTERKKPTSFGRQEKLIAVAEIESTNPDAEKIADRNKRWEIKNPSVHPEHSADGTVKLILGATSLLYLEGGNSLQGTFPVTNDQNLADKIAEIDHTTVLQRENEISFTCAVF